MEKQPSGLLLVLSPGPSLLPHSVIPTARRSVD